MATTIDSLLIEVNSTSTNASSGLDMLTQSLEKVKNATKGGIGLTKISNQLTTLNNTIRGIDTTSLNNINKLVTALQPLSQMPKQNISSTLTQLKKIPDIFRALDKVDMAGFGAKILEITTALKPLATEMDKIGRGFGSFPSKLQKVMNTTNGLAKANGGLGMSYINLWAKFRMAYNAVKTIGQFIGNSIKSINSYIENINLFNISLGSYAKEAQEYAETVGDLMGIDPSEWMRSQGIFMTLAKGFGVVNDRAYIMSKNLTQLGYDISSFYNISIEDAMQKLESGLAGELEPLRRIGYDLSQARLEATALALGIDKAVSSMTQAEKAELRYYAIMTQITDSHGDMARTLEAPANQIRILKAQLEQAGRAIGSIFIPALNAVLPYVIATTKVIRILANEIAALFGFTMPEVDYSGIGKIETGAESANGELGETEKELKKIKSATMGFDELNIIDKSTSDTLDSLGKGFEFELPEYDFIGDLTESKVNIIVEEMKEWLGITGEIKSWSDLFDTKLGDILKTVIVIGTSIAAWKVTKSFLDSITLLKWLLTNPTYSIAISAILTITGLVISFSGMKDAIEKGLDGFNFAEILAGGLFTTAGATILGSKFVTWLGTAFSSPKIAFFLSKLGLNLGVSTTGALGAALGAGIAGIIIGIPTFFTGVYDAIKRGIDWLNATLIPLGATAAGAGIGTIIGMLGGPIGAGLGALIGLAIGFITDFTIWFWQKFEAIEKWFDGLPAWGKVLAGVFRAVMSGTVFGLIMNVITLIKNWEEIVTWVNDYVIQPIGSFFEGLWLAISGFFTSLWENIVNVWHGAGSWFNNMIITPIVKFFKGMWEAVSGFFVSLWEGIVNVWNTVSTWFDTYVIQPIVSFFEGLFLRIGQFAEGCWLIIQAVWVVSTTWFDTYIIQPIINFFKQLWEDISGFFEQLWADIVATWVEVSTWFNEKVVTPIVNFFKALWESIAGFFKSLWEDITKIWKDVATWFNEKVVEPVVGFFKGVWTSVSGFFSSLWEDIVGVWKSVVSWFTTHITDPIKKVFEKVCDAISGFFSALWLGVRQGVAKAMNGVIGAIEAVLNGVVKGINGLIGGFDKIVQWAADVLGKDWGGITLVNEVKFKRVNVPTYAEGGFPDTGQMFIAREAGAELVGNIGRRTAVVNNEQIVASVSAGVAEANSEQTALLKEQNALLRALLEKESSVRIDGKDLTKSVEKYQRERGRVLITGGAY